jgi:pyridoxine 4-dehydrogenase
MANPDANRSGTFKVGGEIEINRLGFGAMRITGNGVWGEPADRREALRTLRRLPELGINFIDTADAYGPDVSERLIHKALHPYRGILVATKGGFARPGPGQWTPRGTPDYLVRQAEKSCRQLGVDQIGLWQLHRIDPQTARDAQFGTIKSLLERGIIRYAGLSEVSIAEIEAARKFFEVATVQNHYNLVTRGHEDVLDYCERNKIGFIPFFPLAAGELVRTGGPVAAVAKAHGATPSQIVLAWLLRRSSVMLPIPGTSKVAHLEENVAAASIQLSETEFIKLDRAGREARN